MNNKEMMLNVFRQQGKADALDLRNRAPEMDGTGVIAEEEKIPAFDSQKDYSGWKAGQPVTDEGQVWLLIQPYNAAHFEGRPSTLRALWGLAHTKDPKKAKEFVAPYGTSGLWKLDECCTENGRVYRNLYDGHEYPPSVLPERWEDLGTVEEVQG